MFRKTAVEFLKDESGATAIEYGLIAALVSVAAISALGTMGDSLVNIFGTVSGELKDATAQAGGSAGGDTGGTGDTSGGTGDTSGGTTTTP